MADIRVRFTDRCHRILKVFTETRAKIAFGGWNKVDKAINDLDFSDSGADYNGVSELIHDVERKLGLSRGNYSGY